MYEITKSFNFCYGHRVHNQMLEGEFASDCQCACRHLHGHEGVVHLTLTSLDFVNPLIRGMVTDFRHTEWLKKFIDETIDHKFILDRNDPLYYHLTKMPGDKMTYPESVPLSRTVKGGTELRKVGSVLRSNDMLTVEEEELMQSFFVVDFVPTSENLSAWLFDIVSWKMARLAQVTAVDWWETAKSHSKYTGA